MKALIESVEFVEGEEDVKPELKFGIPQQASLVALVIRPSSSSSSVDEGASVAPSPSRFPKPWGLRGQSQGHIPKGDLGQADPPRQRGRPKGSKSRPRVAFRLATLPERQEKLKAEEQLAKMLSK